MEGLSIRAGMPTARRGLGTQDRLTAHSQFYVSPPAGNSAIATAAAPGYAVRQSLLPVALPGTGRATPFGGTAMARRVPKRRRAEARPAHGLVIFAAVYLLWMYQRVAFGELRHEANRRLADLTPREWAVLVPVLVLIVWIGVYPKAFTAKTEASVQALIAQVEIKASVARAPVWFARQ